MRSHTVTGWFKNPSTLRCCFLIKNSEGSGTSAVLRVSQLPLVRSVLQSVTTAYSGVKGRYPLLGLVGDVAEVGVRSISYQAMRRATPLLQSLEPQIDVANSYALVGLDRLERNFPILNQSTDEVISHLRDAFFLTLDDVQLWVVDGLDGTLDRLERVADAGRAAVRQLQETQVGRAAASGLDEVLSRLEDATAFYLPLPPTLRREWEMRVQAYEDEDEDDEPSLWTRVRSLLLTLSLQLYHRMMKVREQLQNSIKSLGNAADKVGLGRVLDVLDELLRSLQNLLVVLLYQVEGLRDAAVNRVRSQAAMLAELSVVHQLRDLPVQTQQLLREMQELSKILLQLLINGTPLYNVEVEDFLNQEDIASDSSSRRDSANSLFLKAMDGRPRRRRSLFSRAARRFWRPAEASTHPPKAQSSLKGTALGLGKPAASLPMATQRRPSATELAADAAQTVRVPEPEGLRVPESQRHWCRCRR
uniref:Perilipin 6 n=1 Tax=Amphiprion percula TaxID=161767 RepID=A0A3P8T2U9_AMPPE